VKIVDQPGILYPLVGAVGRELGIGSEVRGGEKRRYENDKVRRQRNISRRVGRMEKYEGRKKEVGFELEEGVMCGPRKEDLKTWGERSGEPGVRKAGRDIVG